MKNLWIHGKSTRGVDASLNVVSIVTVSFHYSNTPDGQLYGEIYAKYASLSILLVIQFSVCKETWNWGKIDDGKINDDLFVENARTQTIDFIISFTNFLLQNKRCKRERAVTPNWDTQSHRPLYHSLN